MPEQKAEQKPKLLLLGFGDINQRLANLKRSDSFITAVRRSETTMLGVQCKAGDVTDRGYLLSLLSERPDQIVITLSPSERSEQGYIDTYLAAAKNLITCAGELGNTPEVIFISSSSVYGQNSGELISEKSECSPTRYNGRILLEAEQCLIDSSLPSTVIRFSGIYGPGRYRLIKMSEIDNIAKSGRETQPETTHWTNRIHADDCARAIAHILNIPAAKREFVYLANDNEPVPSYTVKQWITQRLKGNDSVATETATTLSYLSQDTDKNTGKRCSNTKLVESGFEFRYPSYREGFPKIISQYLNQR